MWLKDYSPMDNKPTYEEIKKKVRGFDGDLAIGHNTREKPPYGQNWIEMITQNVGAGLCIISKDYRTLWANKIIKELFGDVEGKTCYETFNQRTEICPECGVKEIFETGKEKVVHEQKGKDAEGNTIWSEIIDTPLKNKDGNVVAALELVVPITERKRAEEKLRASEEKFRKIFDNANIMIWGTYSDGNIRLFNKEAELVTGYSQEEIIGKQNLLLHPPEEREEIIEKFSSHKEGVLKKNLELGVYTKDEKRLKVLLAQATFKEESGEDFYVALMQDITERKQAEKELTEHRQHLEKLVEQRTHELTDSNKLLNKEILERKQAEKALQIALREKEVLLQEIYHRTKNNMGVICSLLSLQSGYTNDEQALQLFNETSNRIKSMALVHEKLYQAQDLSNINLSDYIKDLANNLLKNYQTAAKKISLKLDTDNIKVSIDAAVPCGLIINELLTNSLKHAFPDNQEGEIRVSLHLMADDLIELLFADNGIGLPEDFDLRNTSTLGMQLIVGLAENQLRGKVEKTMDKGVEFKIRFKPNRLIRI